MCVCVYTGGMVSRSDLADVLEEIYKVDHNFRMDPFLIECQHEIAPNILEAYLQRRSGQIEINLQIGNSHELCKYYCILNLHHASSQFCISISLCSGAFTSLSAIIKLKDNRHSCSVQDTGHQRLVGMCALHINIRAFALYHCLMVSQGA